MIKLPIQSLVRLSTLFFFLTLFGGTAVFAEEFGQSEDVALPTVRVTAEKRTTDAQKTALTMDVITAQEIEDAGIENIQDVFKLIPNLVVASNYTGGMNHMTYRGAHSSAATETNPLIIYVDDVPIETFQTLDVNLANIERIEVLRGAQGVIYGKNAFAGVIRIITKKPGDTHAGKALAQVNSRGGYGGGGSVSGPIVDNTLYYSLTGTYDLDNGFLKAADNTDREETTNERLKGQVRYTPSDRVDLSLMVDYSNKEIDQPHYNVTSGTVSMTSLASPDDVERSSLLNLALSGSLDFDDFTLESITTDRHEDMYYKMDWTPLGVPGYEAGRDSERQEVTQELRVRSKDDKEGMQWLFGLYGSYTDYDMGMYQNMGLKDVPFRMFSSEFAPFGQLEFPLTSSLKLVTGLRWHYVHRNANVTHTTTATQERVEGTWNELAPRVTLSYQIDDDRMVYAGVSRSFIPGGICYSSMSAGNNLKYDSQKAWNYELGAKTEWMDNKLRVNPVLFYNYYTDLQEMTYDSGTGSFIASNPGEEAVAYGVELDVMYLLFKGVEADMSLGYTKAQYKKYTDYTGASYDNNSIIMSPEFTGRAGLQYRSEAGLFLRGDVNYVSSFYWDGANSYKRSPVLTVDARVGWEWDSFDVYAYGKNIFGTRYLDYYSTANNLAYTAETETFGLEVSCRF